MIETHDHGAVREIRMNRPPANALSPDLVQALTAHLTEALEGEPDAVVVSGLPGMFSGGLDVPYLIGLERQGIRSAWRDFIGLLERIATSPKPVSAAITGHSPAGGAVISLFCDYRVMAEGSYKIGLNEVEVGIILPSFMFEALKRLVGERHAERMATGALMVPAEEAFRIGLIDELAPLDEVVERAVAWSKRLLALPPRAMSETRRAARRDLVALFERADEAYLEELVDLWFSDETQAALAALVGRLTGRETS